jgi:hypothetical protein
VIVEAPQAELFFLPADFPNARLCHCDLDPQICLLHSRHPTSEGYQGRSPWLVGKYALRHAFRAKVSVDSTLEGIAERGADPVLEGRYQKAVASSPQRESVLRALASKISRDGEVWTTEAYKVALDDDVDNSSQYVGQLVTPEYGAEIEKIRERYYRFKDSLFAAYVNARPRPFSKTGASQETEFLFPP